MLRRPGAVGSSGVKQMVEGEAAGPGGWAPATDRKGGGGGAAAA